MAMESYRATPLVFVGEITRRGDVEYKWFGATPEQTQLFDRMQAAGWTVMIHCYTEKGDFVGYAPWTMFDENWRGGGDGSRGVHQKQVVPVNKKGSRQ